LLLVSHVALLGRGDQRRSRRSADHRDQLASRSAAVEPLEQMLEWRARLTILLGSLR
jgi:hypothetical protein